MLDRPNAARPLAAGLVAAAEWFNGALLDQLADRGWPRLSRNQSQVFPLLSAEGSASPSDIARGLGITRQSAHTLLGQLVDLGILERAADPADGRRTLVALSARGRALARDAREILAELEAELARRIGEDAVEALRRALAADWGDPPSA
jgi:DNA-binding MarR family transcriptional regulator